jgi:SAM-dependent methyltransferase
MDIRESYDSAAEAYAEHLATELAGKPLDRHLLNRFAEEARGQGLVADLGCGPGHVARYLHDQGLTVVGIDLSPEMIAVARRLNPDLSFQVGDMKRLDLPDAGLAGVVAFYSIVHFEPAELIEILREMRRTLAPGGLALISFHIGDQVVHVEDLFGARVSLDFRFHVPQDVIETLRRAHFDVLEQIEREPYKEAEYPSRRCYLLARRPRAEIIDKVAWIHVEDGRILAARSHGKDLFYFPGGKREPGESDETCLAREIAEELNVSPRPETLRWLGNFEAQAHGKPEGTLVRMACYAAEFSGELRASSEVAEFAWLTYADRDRCSAVARIILDSLHEQGKIQ